MAVTRGLAFVDKGSAAGTIGPQYWVGGRAALIAYATTTFPTSIQLQFIGGDGVSLINVGASVTVAGMQLIDLPAGQYQIVVVGATSGLHVGISSIPYV